MSTAGPAAASAVTSTSVWASPLRWAVIQAPATARQARGYTHSDGRARWFWQARNRRRASTPPPGRRLPGRPCAVSGGAIPVRSPGSEYPGEPVLRLADDVQQILMRRGQPAAGQPGHKLLRDEVSTRARQPA